MTVTFQLVVPSLFGREGLVGAARWVTVARAGAKTAFTLSKGSPNWSPDKVGAPSGVVIEVDDV